MENAYLSRLRYGVRAAEKWYAGLSETIESLTTFPHRFPVASEGDVLGSDLRQMVYGIGSSAYRVLYRVIEPDDDYVGIVRVMTVRSAVRSRDS